ncbi:MAG: hypothetical protein GY934_04005, partial [Gammaproteobacteria bacterium]|nr:hypothetical protein [Gammaproteobacteria bacterium]
VDFYLIGGGETAYALPIQTGSWQSVDIPLSDFSGVDLTQVIQFKFDAQTAGDSPTLYIDNLYFHTVGGGSGGGTAVLVNGNFEAGDFTGWTQSSGGGAITLDSSEQGGRTGTVARLVASGSSASAQDVLLSQIDLVEIDSVAINGGDSVTVSVDVFGSLSGAGGVVFVELISRNSGSDETGRSFIGPAPITPTTTWTTYSSTVNVAADVSGGITLQLKSSCGAVDGCVVDASFDNVSIVAAGGGGVVAEPSDAPVAPTASDTISIFSDAYTDVTGVDTNPGWGQTTVTTTESVASNDVLKMAGLTFQGIDFGGARDVSGHDTVHIDFWTADATAVDFYLIGGGETAYALPIQTGSWQSVDIPLSDFSGVDLTQVIQFKFDAQTAGDSPTMYIDNLYFHTVG